MEGLSNGICTVIQLWKPINVKNPEDGDDTCSETSDRTSAKRHKVPDGVFSYEMFVSTSCNGTERASSSVSEEDRKLSKAIPVADVRIHLLQWDRECFFIG
jgi:hypothetical protein